VERVERDMITVDLEHTNGNVTAAAQQLGITPRMLRYKIKRLGINRPQTSGRRN
jgi:DNA-binding NtrC family response regulator